MAVAVASEQTATDTAAVASSLHLPPRSLRSESMCWLHPTGRTR